MYGRSRIDRDRDRKNRRSRSETIHRRETDAQRPSREVDGARDLIAKFRIAHASLADAARERECDLVDVETLKRESVV